MSAFSVPRNGANLISIIDATAHSVSLFQENENLKISMKCSFLKQVFQ